MKKNSGTFVKFIAAILLVLPFFASVGQIATVKAAASEATVTLHKKKMTEAVSPLIQNTGNAMSEFDKYQGLGDVEFTVYDVTEAFYAAREAGQTVDEAKATVQNTTGTEVTKGNTNASGDLSLTLPKKSNGKNAVYTIVETPKSGVTVAANLVIAFPVYEMIKGANGYTYGDVELDTVHLYPKNVLSTPGSVTLTKVGSGENEALSGAEFIVSKVEAGATKYIQSSKDGLYTWTTNEADAYRFVTGQNYQTGDAAITSATGEVGKLFIDGIEVGNYQFKEVKAPTNAELIENEIYTDFEIKENQTATTAVQVVNDTTNVEKTTPQLNGKDVQIGDAIDYQIKVNIPLGIADEGKYTKFNLVDTHDAALTFINDAAKYELKDNDTVIDPANYTITEGTNGFTVVINPNYLTSLTPGGTLTFNYQMKLNEKADPTQGFSNSANVDNGGHTEDKTPPTVEVTTGGKQFVKVDGDVKSDVTLADAEFVVRDQNSDTAKYLKIDETSKAVSWVTTYEEATKFLTAANGIVDVTGLSYGTYYLEETKAPNDYVKLTDRIEFEVNETSYSTTETTVAAEKVANKHKGTLPSTGGMGIVAFIGAGVLAIALASVYFSKRKKMHEA